MARNRYKPLTPAEVRSMSNKELRAAYSKARAVANKRQNRVLDFREKMGAPADFRERRTFKPLRGMSNSEVQKALLDTERYLHDPRSTITGERKFIDNLISDLHEKSDDYKFIDWSNIYDFIHMMDEKRDEVGDKLFDSGDFVDAFANAERLKLPGNLLKKNMDWFIENADKLEKMRPEDVAPTYGKHITFAELRMAVRKLV